jgi:hypothetical protein
MGSVTIGGNPYTVYGTSTLAGIYWTGRQIGPMYDAWSKASADKKASAQVMAYDILERQLYVDAAATFDLRDAIQAFRDASYQLAAMILADPNVYSQVTSGKNIKKVEAAVGTSVEFFNPTLGISGRFENNIQELIGQYLKSSSGGEVSGSFASGTTENQTSAFDPTAFGINKGL